MANIEMSRMGGRTRTVLLLGALVAVALSGCGAGGRGNRGDFEVERVYGEGTAVQFAVRLSQTTVTTAEQLVLELETRAGEDWRVSFPEVPEELGGFAVVDREPEDRELLADKTLVSTRSYRLEPFLPGEYAIPALELGFGEPGTEFSFTLVSEEIDVEVESELPPTVGEQDIEDIEEPQELEQPLWPWITGGAGALVLLAAAATVLVVRIRRRTSRRAAQAAEPPWTEAQNALDALLSSEEQIDADRLYTELTGIVRRYIERRFEIKAPGQTTEEFLDEARRSEQLAPYRETLEQFLTHADLVKFAAYEPSEEEIGSSIEACRGFVEATAPGGAA